MKKIVLIVAGLAAILGPSPEAVAVNPAPAPKTQIVPQVAPAAAKRTCPERELREGQFTEWMKGKAKSMRLAGSRLEEIEKVVSAKRHEMLHAVVCP